jgi:hypothetical protein
VDEKMLPGLWRRYRGLPRNVFAIGLVSLLNDASSEIIYPLLPIFLAGSLGASARAIRHDRRSRRVDLQPAKTLRRLSQRSFGQAKVARRAGYSIASLARPLLAFAQTWTQVLAIRLTDRMGKGSERRRATR